METQDPKSSKPDGNREAHLALKALQSVGGLDWKVIVPFVLLVLLVNFIGNFGQDIVDTFLNYPAQEIRARLITHDNNIISWITYNFFYLAPVDGANSGPSYLGFKFVVVFTILLITVACLRSLALKKLGELRPKVHFDRPHNVKAIIMFLSTPSVANDGESHRKFNENLRLVAQHIKLVSYAKSHDNLRLGKTSLRLKNLGKAEKQLDASLRNFHSSTKSMTDELHAQAHTDSFYSEALQSCVSDMMLADETLEKTRVSLNALRNNYSFIENGPGLNVKEAYRANEENNILQSDITKLAFQIDEKAPLTALERDELIEFFCAFNWRMNIEALRFHIQHGHRLKHIVVIPSIGSMKWAEPFMAMLRDFLAHHDINDVKVCLPKGTVKSEKKTYEAIAANCLSYEDMTALIDTLYRVNTNLKYMLKCDDDDILVDITSGKSLCSAAGMAFATLVDRRKVQYVDTNDYSINSYDVTHDVDRT